MFNYHLDPISEKISPKIGILRKLKTFIPSDILFTIYLAYMVHQHINYLIWVYDRLYFKATSSPESS